MVMRSELAASLARYGRYIHSRGWVANHDGNLTVKLDEERLLITPTSVSKGDLTEGMMLVVDRQGKVLEGARRSFSELTLHLACYGSCPKIGAVVHAHPPFATALACSGVEIGVPFLAEAVVSLGARVPTARFALPYGEEGAAPVRELAAEVPVMLLEGHGVLAHGKDLEQAVLRLELVEHLARIYTIAKPLGGPRPLPADEVQRLLSKRAGHGLPPKEGLAPAPTASGGASATASRPPVVPAASAWMGGDHVRTEAACGVVYGAAPGADAAPEGASAAGDEGLDALVRREIARVLKG